MITPLGNDWLGRLSVQKKEKDNRLKYWRWTEGVWGQNCSMA